MIFGLENVEILRYGVIYKNMYLEFLKYFNNVF